MEDYLGQSHAYWLELKRRMEASPDALQASALLVEVLELRGRLSFLESRVREMAKVLP